MSLTLYDKLYSMIGKPVNTQEMIEPSVTVPKTKKEKIKWTLKSIIQKKPAPKQVRKYFKKRLDELNEDSDIEEDY